MTYYAPVEAFIVFGFSLAAIVGFLVLAEFIGWLLFREEDEDA